MRGNQATQEVPQSSFAMTILPGAAPARVRKERAPKDEAPAQPKEPRAPRFTLRAHKEAPVVDVAPPFETAQPFETAEPVEVAAPVEFAPPAAEAFSPPPPAAEAFSPPPPPAQFSPPPPAQFAPPQPQFTPTADRFGQVSPSPVHEEPAVSGWYAPVDAPAPEAPAADYPPPTAYPMAPGYPPQPPYAEQSHFGYPQQAVPQQADPQQYAGNPNLSLFAPPPPAGSWVPQHAAPGAGISNSGRSTGAKILIGVGIVLGVMVLIAVAIPVFLSQRQPANRNVVLPTTLIDAQRITGDPNLDAETAQGVSAMQKVVPGGSQTQAAYYGLDGAPTFMVVAGKLARKPTSGDVKTYFTQGTASDDPVLTKLGSGPFGGTLECGTSTVGGVALTECASLDNAAAVLVMAGHVTPTQLATMTRQILEQIETKG